MAFGLFKKKRVFEDCFMEIQEGMIALCLELAEKEPVEDVYVYGAIEEGMRSFNAFFVKDGKVLAASQLVNDRSLSTQFLREGARDLEKLIEVCKEFDKPVPAELRLHHVVGGGLDTHYEYEPVLTVENELTPYDVLVEWMNSVKEEIEKKNT